MVQAIFAPDTVRNALAKARSGTCHRDDENMAFNGCVETGAGPLLFLWGDSHAAALYFGLHDLQKRRSFRIAEYTLNGCPPLLDHHFPGREKPCEVLNERGYQRIKSLMPDIVVLDAYWHKDVYHLYDPATDSFDAAPLLPTIARLKVLGIANIVLVGPVPTWNEDLKHIVYKHFERDPARRLPPLRMKQELQPGLQPTAAALRRLAADLRISYISPLDVFCDADGCLTRTGNPPNHVAAGDASHLSSSASAFLVDAMEPLLFEHADRSSAP
jgi:hypothetical protein